MRAAWLLVLAALAPAVRAGELVVRDAAHGFTVARPDETWITYPTEPQGAAAAWTLTLFPRGSQGLPSAVIYVAPHDGKGTSESVREAAAAKLRKEGTEVTLDDATLAGQPAKRLRASPKTATGLAYEVELLYLVAPPEVYALQITWAAGSEPDEKLAALRDSFAIFAPEAASADPDQAKLHELAGKCGSDLGWAADWEAAAARARAEDKPVLVAFEHYTGLSVPHTLDNGAFMDADLSALVRERFVPLRLEEDETAPFRDAAGWGMGGKSWGGLVLFVSPDGKVLEQCGLGNVFLITDAARRVLAARPGPPHENPPRDPDARLAQAELALRRGELDRAEALLAHADGRRAHRLRATLRRQQRRGEDALTELAAAREGADDGELAEIAVEQAVVQLRLAEWSTAQDSLQAALDKWPDGPRASEAQFWLGAVEMLRQGFPKGRDRWRTLALAHPDDRWAWKAAANVLDGGAFVNGGERLDWPDAATFAAAAVPPRAPLKPEDAGRARREARKFLLSGQRADGSWVAPMDAFNVSASNYTLAVTALCGSALLPDREMDDDLADAVRRAEDFVLAARKAGKLAGGKDMLGVYSIWSRAMVLRFLAQCRGAKLGDEAALADAIAPLLDSVLESQVSSGGWPYVNIGGPGDAGLDCSASFLTAGVLIALLDAREAGVTVPQGPLDRGLSCLRSLRKQNGSFRYFVDVPEADDNPEAAGRGPVCALALLRGGAGNADELRRSLQTFDDQRSVLAREWGKDVCHTGQQGQGAHYLFYDWAFAAAAVAQLPAADRGPWRKPLLTDILAVHDAEGGFADMPSLGRAYGTAMALMALRELAPE